MKITFDIDCTPEEARTFLGLPDVQKMQEHLVKQIQEKMTENISGLDSEQMMKTWMPTGMQNMDQMQKMFWSQFSNKSTDK